MRQNRRSNWLLLLCAGFLSHSACAPKPDEVLSSPRVVGGKLAELTPYMAGLVDEGGTYAFCGGTFIAPRIVMTAAHCVEDSFKKIKVSAGILRNEDHTTAPLIPVEAVFVHPDYDSDNLQNDIAILHLASYDPLTLPISIEPLPLNIDPEFPSSVSGTKVTVTGWGNTSSFGKLFDGPLRTADLDVISVDQCSLAPGYDDVGESQICAGDLIKGGIDACNGDSGGPLVAKDSSGAPTLVGIVSWGEGCAQAGKPGVYTRVSHFKPWIDAELTSLEPRANPLQTQEIKKIIDSYCYDGWAETVDVSEAGQNLKIATQFRVDGVFTPVSLENPGFRENLNQPESSLPPCVAHLSEGLSLSGAVRLDHEARKSVSAARIIARQDQPSAAWTAPARKISKLSLSCPDIQAQIRSYNPTRYEASVDFDHKKFKLLNREPDGLKPDDERQTCSQQGHSVTFAKRVAAKGRVTYLAHIESDLFEDKAVTYRLAEDVTLPKIELLVTPKSEYFGTFSVRNQSDDDIHTWRLECDAAFGLIDQFGTYYPPVLKRGGSVHNFAKPSHLLGTIPAGGQANFTYDSWDPITSTRGLNCSVNNQTISLRFL